jgi:tetratricopeptide (TPR) repeat protein
LNIRRTAVLLLALTALTVIALVTPGCGVINRLRAKNALNDGVREYNKGKFENAQKQFEYALDLSPDLTNAQLFKARALNARFDADLSENLAKQTIAAYDDIITRNPDNHEAVDQSLAFKANLYDQLTRVAPEKAKEYKQLQRDTLEKRANLPWATAKTKADVFYTLGVSYWKESYDSNAGYILKKQSIPPKVFDDMKPLVQKAHEYLQKTISVDPNYANAWFYEKLVYLEELKYDTAHQKELAAKATEMQDKYLALQKQQAPAAPQGEPSK